MQLPTLSLKYKAIIWISLAGCVTLGSIIGIIIPTQHQLTTTVAAIHNNEQTINDANQTVANVVHLKKFTSQADNPLDQLAVAFVPKDDPLSLIDELEQLATEQGVSLTLDIGDTTAITTDSITPIELTINATGNFANVLNYTHRLTTLPTAITINEVLLSPVDYTTASDDVMITLSTLTYWQ